MKYYISDLHFGHKNVINFDKRPFETVEEMEHVIITNWNKKVKNSDIVYILGDFCFKSPTEWIRLLSILNGEKHLIIGNHDENRLNNEIIRMFKTVQFYKEVKDCGRKVILSHYPILFYKQAYSSNTYMLFGHVHNKTEEVKFVDKYIKDLQENCSLNYAKLYNVGCMMPYMNYTPMSLDEIILGNCPNGETVLADKDNME